MRQRLLKVTEVFRRVAFDRLELQVTMEDAKALVTSAMAADFFLGESLGRRPHLRGPDNRVQREDLN